MAITSLAQLQSFHEAQGIAYESIDPDGGDFYRSVVYNTAPLLPTQTILYTVGGIAQSLLYAGGGNIIKYYAYDGALTGISIFSNLSPLTKFAATLVFAVGVVVDNWDAEEPMIWTFTATLSLTAPLYHPTDYYKPVDGEEDLLPSPIYAVVTDPDVPTIVLYPK